MTSGHSSVFANWGVMEHPEFPARMDQLCEVCPSLASLPLAALTVTSPDTRPFTLQLLEGQLTLLAAHEPRWSGIAVDFLAGTMAHRRRQPVGGELVVKAVWGRGKDPFTVLDATAGLGRDGFLLAASGATVVSCERHPAIAMLLADGYWRARQSGELEEVLSRWTLHHGNAIDLMTQMNPDVIYLDPMFPEREKTALVKKEMRAFRELVGEDQDAQALFDAACAHARKRVVVKRPATGESLGRKPSHVLEGKSNRFDVYATGNKS